MMLTFHKNTALIERNIPFGYVEVHYPEQLNVSDFRALVETELAALREKYAD